MANPFAELINKPVETDSWRWGNVVATNPLRVRLDGDSEPLTATPDSLVHCVVGDRVRCHVYNRRITIVGMPPNMQVDGVNGQRVLNNGWEHWGGDYDPVRLRRDSSGVCYLTGLMRTGKTTHNTLIARFPAVLAPLNRHIFMTTTPSSPSTNPYNIARLDIAGNELQIMNDSRPVGTFVSVDGISWIPGQ